jgi:hypothetical protein
MRLRHETVFELTSPSGYTDIQRSVINQPAGTVVTATRTNISSPVTFDLFPLYGSAVTISLNVLTLKHITFKAYISSDYENPVKFDNPLVSTPSDSPFFIQDHLKIYPWTTQTDYSEDGTEPPEFQKLRIRDNVNLTGSAFIDFLTTPGFYAPGEQMSTFPSLRLESGIIDALVHFQVVAVFNHIEIPEAP